MSCPDPGTRQDGDDAFDDHRHVDDDPIADLNVEVLLERASEGLHALVQLRVGDARSLSGGRVTVPVMGLSTK